MILGVVDVVEEVVMARVEAMAGYGVFALAIALLAAFTMWLAVPSAELMRAAEAPHVVLLHPELIVTGR